jgi:hypothetical protein
MNRRVATVSLVAALLGGGSIGMAVAQRASGTGTADSATVAPWLVPHESWSSGMPDGIPAPERGTPIFDIAMTLDRHIDLGRTPYGHRRVAIVQEGTVSGARLAGAVMHGGLDFELTLANGVIEIEQILVLRTDDGQYILVRMAGTGVDANDVRIVLDVEAPTAGASAWLNTGTFVARRAIDPAARTMTLRVYDLSGVAAPADRSAAVRITKPAGVPPQPWDYRRAAPSETRGPELITETVTLSPSQSVGASKRGPRNIIPITGGELRGRITGVVLPGGADYQLLAAPATIDARYLWETTDGEVIIVRNGGAFGSLVPTFEVRTDSPYAWLNTGLFLSSNPGMAPGGVNLTFYESAR